MFNYGAGSGVVDIGMAKQRMSQGDYKGGQFGAHGYIIRGKAARILPGEGFEAKIRALGFLVLGNLGYSLFRIEGECHFSYQMFFRSV